MDSVNKASKKLEKVAEIALKGLRVRNSRVFVFLVSRQDIKDIKKKFNLPRREETLNVLVFAEPAGFPHPEGTKKILGEIYLNRDIIQKDFGQAAFFLVHGLLHLLGYRHAGKTDIIKMERAEKKLMRALDIDIE